MANKINHIIDAYRSLDRQSDYVLATIIETSGSTYQKAGARMLITRQGELTGLLGGGCFERDLVEQAASVFETGTAKTVFYDMRSSNDVVWGLGLGCNGAVRVLLQLLTAKDDFWPLNSIVEAAEANKPVILTTVYESTHDSFPAGYSLFLPASAGTIPMASFPCSAEMRQTVLQQKPRLETQDIDGQEIKVFYEQLQPPSRLLVVGAGADAVPLVQCAKTLGWHVTVVDHRPGHIDKQRFPTADRLLPIVPEELAVNLELDQFTASVLMTHNFEYDRRYLRTIVSSGIPFVGLLGPVHRKDRLLQNLDIDDASVLERLFGPVGLNIGAETPEEIALSIMAGIHAALNGRNGQQLGVKFAADCHAYS